MKRTVTLAFAGLVILGITACTDSSSKESVDASSVYSVTDFDYTMNSQQAVSITFGQTPENNCSVTIYRASVSNGYDVKSLKNNEKSISAECSWDSAYYVQSSKHPTSVTFKIIELNTSDRTASMNISLALVDPRTDKIFELNNVAVNVSGQNFDNLVKQVH